MIRRLVKMTPPPLLHLNGNLKIPPLGMGTAKLKGASGVEAIKVAIDAGYRLFDTAFLYGNEEIVGEAIREKCVEGSINREEITVIGKLWSIHHDLVEKACRDSCRRLNVDYIDLYLLHFPVLFRYKGDEAKWPESPEDLLDKDYMDVWREMEKLIEKGLVKHIGVSNFNAQQIQRLFDCSFTKPVCNEIEFHPAFSKDELIKLCEKLNVKVLAYCPLGRHKEEKMEPKFLYDERVVEIGRKYNKSTAQIALRFEIQCGVIPLPKSGRKERIYENLNVFDFHLSVEEMSLMKSFNDDKNQICKFHFAEKSVYYPY